MAKDISKIDKNLAVAGEIDAPDCVFHDVRKAPFEIYGLYKPTEGTTFRRLPEEVAKATSEGVFQLHTNTAGGRVRFSTDSEYIAIKCAMPDITHFSHMPLTGVAGFDMYVSTDGTDIFAKTFTPPYDMTSGYVSIHHFGNRKMREITINFPLYNNVDALFVGLEPDATIGNGRKYKYEKPVVYYGSSITQGGCASRPGNCYEAMISQKLDCNHINLGFSGNAKGEDAIIDYIANLPMSVFVYDYTYNTPSLEHLIATHEKGFKKIREKNPDLPIIIVSSPLHDFHGADDLHRTYRLTVFETYMNAYRNGDRNVYFVDGASLFDGELPNSCTVDGCHPTDLGFFRMAEGIGRAVQHALFS